MNTRTISLTGARGGHGTTTIAAALALFAAGHQRTALVSSDPSTSALIGVASSVENTVIEVTPTLALAGESSSIAALAAELIVIDASTATSGPHSDIHSEHYVVLRGPCYVALSSLLADTQRPDGIILVAEPKRSLTSSGARLRKCCRRCGRALSARRCTGTLMGNLSFHYPLTSLERIISVAAHAALAPRFGISDPPRR